MAISYLFHDWEVYWWSILIALMDKLISPYYRFAFAMLLIGRNYRRAMGGIGGRYEEDTKTI